MPIPKLQVIKPDLSRLRLGQDKYTSWLDRRALFAKLDEVGLPSRRSERWKYQNPKLLVDDALSISSQSLKIESDEANVVSFDELHNDLITILASDLAPTFNESSMLLMNGLLFSDGWFVDVPQRKVNSLTFDGVQGSVGCVFLNLGTDSETRLLDKSSGGSRVLYCKMAPGSSLDVIRTQPQIEHTEYQFSKVVLDERCSLNYRMYGLGSSFRSNEMEVDCRGRHASVSLSGIWRIGNNEQVNHFFSVRHSASNCKSKQLFRSVVKDRGRSVFNGRIHIGHGASDSDAELVNRNICLSDESESYAKPELAIFNDDVTCSHGVTTSQLDESATFYLRSRGIPREYAQKILLDGFLRELAPDDAGKTLLDL